MLTLKQQQEVDKKFEQVKSVAINRAKELFDVLESCTEEEKICMKYLFAYMPLGDLASYTGELFLKFVRHALKVKSRVPWGEKLEDTVFLNYVLQYRINNENIEFFSEAFFDEIYPRIKGLDMYQAAIAVNYWCYEKATYQTTDMRTASPLTVIRRAYGRCGEESTLTVAALRSVGIPARQCYTPRWAHCDDNHAWVEVWIEGTWHFLGACEPEMRLNTGWFRMPASRGMLIHNRVFSDLVEEEIITSQTPRSTEVNILHHYAKTKKLSVKVVDEKGNPLKGIHVRFEIVNYAELYPVADLKTDEGGKTNFVTGLGDVFVFVHNEDYYAYEKVDVRLTDHVEIVLAEKPIEMTGQKDLIQVPPLGGIEEEAKLTKEQEETQKVKNQQAEKIRKAFESTFYDGEKGKEYAKKWNPFEKEVAGILKEARGNYEEIISFLEDEETKTHLEYKVALLQALNAKDLVDTTCSVLKEHFTLSIPYQERYDKAFYIDYIASPRIAFEMITAYRKTIENYFTEEQKGAFRKDPKAIYAYINEEIETTKETEYATLNASPIGLLELKVGNELSKKILFVAICRTFGIPAKVEKTDGMLEYYAEGEWHSVTQRVDQTAFRTATLTLEKSDKASFDYYRNYTLAVFEKGKYTTLELEDESWEGNEITYKVKPGTYRVITANRMADGTLLNRLYFVKLEAHECKNLSIELVEGASIQKEVKVEDRLVKTEIGGEMHLSEILGENNNIVAWLDVAAEPTEHLLNEMLESKNKFNTIKPTIIFMLRADKDRQDPTLKKVLREIPHIQTVISEETARALAPVYEGFDITDQRLPLAVIIEEKLTSHFAWAGYNVGIGEMLLKNLKNTH